MESGTGKMNRKRISEDGIKIEKGKVQRLYGNENFVWFVGLFLNGTQDMIILRFGFEFSNYWTVYLGWTLVTVFPHVWIRNAPTIHNNTEPPTTTPIMIGKILALFPLGLAPGDGDAVGEPVETIIVVKVGLTLGADNVTTVEDETFDPAGTANWMSWVAVVGSVKLVANVFL